MLLAMLGVACDPLPTPSIASSIPTNPSDLESRLVYAFDSKEVRPFDWRLSDEIYPAIFVAVAGWLRGSGRANALSSVLSAAPWLSELIPARRPRMTVALAHLDKVQKALAPAEHFLIADNWEKALAKGLKLTSAQVDAWLAAQAIGVAGLLEAEAIRLSEGHSLPARLIETLPARYGTFVNNPSASTGMGRGIDLDLSWGMNALRSHVQHVPLQADELPALEDDA